ncbi:hypothetical protein BT93_C1951 [Corymbia citriodora subsp. variegata]|nr:hypothetical protein BT93_C1951 [Corymbia citriodora subsp. variegata]
MAMSAASAISILCRPSPSPPSATFPLNTALVFPTKPRRSILIACTSGDNPSETNAATTTTESDASESSIEAPELPPSLISALNVERALRGIAITDVDHYGRLGLSRKCPYDQVAAAYRKKVEEAKGEGLEEDEFNEKLEQLKESYRTLSSVEERRLYDWSLARSEKPDRYMWPFEADITQTPTGSPPPPEPEDEGPTRLVGYFMLGWLVLSFVLSIALNR